MWSPRPDSLSTLRSRPASCWRAFAGCAGTRSPYAASRSRSILTGDPAASTRLASITRLFGDVIGTG